MTRRSIIGLLTAAACVVILAACNPLLGQPTAPRPDGNTRSGTLTYTGSASGWLEVAVNASPVADLTFLVGGRDETRPIVPAGNSCYFTSATLDGWQDGASLGYRRVERIGPGTTFKVQFPMAVDGIRFDARVVNDDGVPIGDLTHAVPDGRFEEVSGAICA